MIFGYCVANQAVLTIGIYRKTALVIVKGSDKMVVILLIGGGVRFRQHSLYEFSAANVVHLYRFQPRTKIGTAQRYSRERGALDFAIRKVSTEESYALSSIILSYRSLLMFLGFSSSGTRIV